MGLLRQPTSDITKGVIWKQLLAFFFPLWFGTFFQQLYNTGDTLVVGRFVGKVALAAVGSVLYFTCYQAVVPTVGALPGLKAFVAAVFGGIGNIPGAVIGALIIGICENIIKGLPSAWDVSVFSDAFTFALLILVLVFKPTGLFGEKVTDKV